MAINRYTSQPQYNATIDYTGLGKGLKILFNPAVGPIDLVTGRVWTSGGSAGIIATPKGKAFSFDGIDDYYAYSGYPEMTGNEGTFFAWFPSVGAPDSFGHVYFGSSSPVVHAYQVDPSGKVFCGNSGSSGTISGWFNTTNRSLVCVSSLDASRIKAYVDGRDTGLTWPSSSAAWGAGNKTLNLGRYVGGSSWDTDASMSLVGWTSERWTVVEALAFYENPWQLFKYSTRGPRFVISIGGNTYTISPSGALILSGSSKLIKTKSFLPTGNVSFSGNSELIKGKILLPLGNISITGGTPLVKTKIVNSSGTITLSGTSPIIRSKVIESSGGVIFSGTASLSGAVSYILTPTGSVTFNGSSSLIKTHIQLPTGKISFSGSSPMESNTVIITVSTRLPLTGVGK